VRTPTRTTHARHAVSHGTFKLWAGALDAWLEVGGVKGVGEGPGSRGRSGTCVVQQVG